ncbi:MAG: amidase [Acidimicrobiia bacterium]|nr:amidase [Acidimicrobiia bacterium]
MSEPSAAQIASDVAEGHTTASDQVAAALDRAGKHTSLNIFTRLDPAGASSKAAAVDDRIAAGEPPGPLAGVPFVVKDLIDQAGLPNTCGASFAPFTPASNATCVARLEAAGAIPIGRVGLHEFAFGFSSENPWFGPVRNPLNPNLSTGGSSGGSAAAVAAGIVPLALGTDTGGSVRVPAALCGIAGLKVTHGRGSIRGVYPLATGLDTVGPLARTVADLELAYQVLGAYDPEDAVSRDHRLEPPVATMSASGLRFAVPHPWVDTGFEPRLGDEWEATLRRLAAYGVTIEHVELPETGPPWHGLASAYYEAARVHRARFEADPNAYGPDLQIRLADAMAVTAQEYAAALEWRASIRAGFDRVVKDFDAIVTPTTAAATKPIGQETLPLTTGAVHYRAPLSHFTSIVNNAGLPALALPVTDTGTPPLSIHLIAGAWEESRLLAIGRGLEEAGLVAS